MNIADAHKPLPLALVLKEEAFTLFDGKSVAYESDENKGARI